MYAILIFIFFFILIYGNYARFAWVIMRWTKKPRKLKNKKELVQPKLTSKERLLGCIPFYQACIVRKCLYRRSGVFNVMAIISFAFIAIRLINTFLLPINSYVMFATIIMMYIGILLHILLYGIVTADCARLYNYGTFCIILCFLFPHLACIHLINNIPHAMIDMRRSQTFEENADDTIIKSKHSK